MPLDYIRTRPITWQCAWEKPRSENDAESVNAR